MTLEMVGTLLLFLGLPGLILFTGLYAWRSAWTTTAAGRVIMQLAVSEIAVLLLAAGNAIYGTDWPGRGLVRTVLYLGMFVAFWRLPIVLLRIQLEGPIPPVKPPETIRGLAAEEEKDHHA